MKVLVVGGGGREHALIRKLKESPRVTGLYCAPGNGGIACDAQIFDVGATDIDGMVRLAKQLAVDLVVVAPDDPLVLGMVDALHEAGFATFGPNRAAAVIEGSKVFSKELMLKYGIPTAGYRVFDQADEALDYIRAQGKYPAVIKADGLALGKGVIIAEDEAQAQAGLHRIMEDKVFGDSGNRVVVEEFITGPEISVLAFTDGKCVKPMVSSMDHKRALDGDKGLNTGGMGTISPNPYYTDAIAQRCMEEIFQPTVDAMRKEGRPFKGCLYFGLMLTADGPNVIEYNCRFGDPEAQVVLPRLETDLIEIFEAISEERLDGLDIRWSQDVCACVVMASGGYPESYSKGLAITGLDGSGQLPGVTVYHAGTAQKDGALVTSSGRVLGVTAVGESLVGALEQAYAGVKQIRFAGAHYRRDIGKK